MQMRQLDLSLIVLFFQFKILTQHYVYVYVYKYLQTVSLKQTLATMDHFCLWEQGDRYLYISQSE